MSKNIQEEKTEKLVVEKERLITMLLFGKKGQRK